MVRRPAGAGRPPAGSSSWPERLADRMRLCCPAGSPGVPVGFPSRPGGSVTGWPLLRWRLVNAHSLRWRFVDAPGSFGDRRRTRRARWLVQQFPDLAEMSVIDLGGRVTSWEQAPVRPRHVHIVNLEPLSTDVPPWARVDQGDA